MLAQHRLSNGDIVRDLSIVLNVISNLAQAQGSDLPEMQKFGILRDLMKNEQRPVVIQTFATTLDNQRCNLLAVVLPVTSGR